MLLSTLVTRIHFQNFNFLLRDYFFQAAVPIYIHYGTSQMENVVWSANWDQQKRTFLTDKNPFLICSCYKSQTFLRLKKIKMQVKRLNFTYINAEQQDNIQHFNHDNHNFFLSTLLLWGTEVQQQFAEGDWLESSASEPFFLHILFVVVLWPSKQN